jgi:hypothetical protein
MGTIVDEISKMNPPADLIALPFQLMSTVSLAGGLVPGTFTPLGLTRMGHQERHDDPARCGKRRIDDSVLNRCTAIITPSRGVYAGRSSHGSPLTLRNLTSGEDDP